MDQTGLATFFLSAGAVADYDCFLAVSLSCSPVGQPPLRGPCRRDTLSNFPGRADVRRSKSASERPASSRSSLSRLRPQVSPVSGYRLFFFAAVDRPRSCDNAASGKTFCSGNTHPPDRVTRQPPPEYPLSSRRSPAGTGALRSAADVLLLCPLPCRH